MLGKLHFLLAAAAMAAPSLTGQTAWVGLPAIQKSPQFERTDAKASLFLIPFHSQNLGDQDGGRPIRTVVQVMNVGSAPFKLMAHPMGGTTKVRIQFPGADDLVVPPGEAFQIPVEYDARLDNGPISFEVAFRSDDPDSPVLRQTFQATVRKSLEANPHRDCILAQSGDIGSAKPIAISFAGDGTTHFQGAVIEDEAAPLRVNGEVTATGSYVGSVSLDWARLKEGKCARHGETRIFGVTDGDRTAYVWIQWYIR